MKILIVGGNGTLGKKVTERLKEKHEVLVAGRTGGDLRVDITDSNSIKNLFEKTGKLDAIVSTAGAAKWAPFDTMSEDDFYIGIKSKLMGQVNLVRIGRDYLSNGGSITLTTGILGDDPVANTTNAAMVNGAIHGFVKAVSLEIKNDIRVNAVSPGLVEDSKDKFGDYFPGHIPVSMDKMVSGYIKSVEGKVRGQVIRIYG
ncbi:MAG: short chain dehydrogenase [Bacteroidetes bacterium]|nr:short chain dehydrogenase [Bacteroidota bacterium]